MKGTMTATSHGFSIVVPTHGRVDLVANLLHSLNQAQSVFEGGSEIILVDSSNGPSKAEIRLLSQKHRARYLRGKNHVAAKRNLGLRAASYDMVFFIDSDCRADLCVLQEHLRMHEEPAPNGAVGVLGVTEWCGKAGPVWRVLEQSSSMTAAFRFAAWFKEVPWGTCTNISFRREALLAVGGFDEQFPLRVYGEDVDLGLRLGKAGYRIVTNPKAMVSHERASMNTFWAALRKSMATGQADYHLGQRHPERLTLEFPGPLTVTLALTVLGGVLFVAQKSLVTLTLPFAYLLFYVLFVTLVSLFRQRLSSSEAISLAGATLLEVAFELGRLSQAARHTAPRRLWTKFIYIDAQLLAERERRIDQSWGMLLSLVLLLLLLQVRS